MILSKQILWWAVGVTLVILPIMFLHRSRGPAPAPYVEPTFSEMLALRDPLAPKTVNRLRIEDYIRRVGSESFDDCARRIAVSEFSLEWANLQGHHQPAHFDEVLANRRVARIYEILKARGKAAAANYCEQQAKLWLDRFDDDLLFHVEYWRNGTTRPDSTERIVRQGYSPDDIAPQLHAWIFMMSQFCKLENTRQVIDRWNQRMKEFDLGVNYELVLGKIPTKFRYEFWRTAMTSDERFQFHIGLMLLERFHRDRFDQVIRELPQGWEYRRVEFCAWNAHTSNFDMPDDGRSLDLKRVLFTVPYVPWYFPNPPDEQRTEQLAKVRRLLEWE